MSLRLKAAHTMIDEIARHLEADFTAVLWDGSTVPMKDGARDDLRMVVTSPDVIRRLILKPSLATLVQLVASRSLALEGGSPLAFINRWDHGKAVHVLSKIDRARLITSAVPFLISSGADPAQLPAYSDSTKNNKGGRNDKEMISFHYDLSNRFFSLFLDQHLVYSTGHYVTGEESLDEAQELKLDLICRKLRLKPGELLLDIGCGWGALACHAAKNYGVSVHGFTLSEEQLQFAKDKVSSMGLTDQVTLELKDYRTLGEVHGAYDKVCQVEMFEHVGWDNFDSHFELIRRVLKPKGIYYHQATTRRGGRDLQNFRKVTGPMAFLSTYIFPGGELDYIGNTITNMGRLGLEVLDVECLREHYMLTTAEWERRLASRYDEAVAEVGHERTLFWLIYLALSYKAFERTSCSNYAVVTQKRSAGRTGLLLDRGALYQE